MANAFCGHWLLLSCDTGYLFLRITKWCSGYIAIAAWAIQLALKSTSLIPITHLTYWMSSCVTLCDAWFFRKVYWVHWWNQVTLTLQLSTQQETSSCQQVSDNHCLVKLFACFNMKTMVWIFCKYCLCCQLLMSWLRAITKVAYRWIFINFTSVIWRVCCDVCTDTRRMWWCTHSSMRWTSLTQPRPVWPLTYKHSVTMAPLPWQYFLRYVLLPKHSVFNYY